VSAMRIPRALVDDMVAHAQADDPNECCGLVSSRNGDAVEVYRTTNTEASKFRFVIDPQEQLRIYNEIDGAGLDLGAIYHSHTRSEPYPSQTDINFAKDWPGVLWIIIGLAGGEPEVKTYEIRDGQVAEADLEVS
jgi:proteasome lid subunit RPN8/RPN11